MNVNKKDTIPQMKINETCFAKVSPSYDNYSFNFFPFNKQHCAENRGIPQVHAQLVVDVAVIMQRQSEVPQTSSSTEFFFYSVFTMFFGLRPFGR